MKYDDKGVIEFGDSAKNRSIDIRRRLRRLHNQSQISLGRLFLNRLEKV